jgi:hypothetical protein
MTTAAAPRSLCHRNDQRQDRGKTGTAADEIVAILVKAFPDRGRDAEDRSHSSKQECIEQRNRREVRAHLFRPSLSSGSLYDQDSPLPCSAILAPRPDLSVYGCTNLLFTRSG